MGRRWPSLKGPAQAVASDNSQLGGRRRPPIQHGLPRGRGAQNITDALEAYEAKHWPEGQGVRRQGLGRDRFPYRSSTLQRLTTKRATLKRDEMKYAATNMRNASV